MYCDNEIIILEYEEDLCVQEETLIREEAAARWFYPFHVLSLVAMISTRKKRNHWHSDELHYAAACKVRFSRYLCIMVALTVDIAAYIFHRSRSALQPAPTIFSGCSLGSNCCKSRMLGCHQLGYAATPRCCNNARVEGKETKIQTAQNFYYIIVIHRR